ncbi:hypothetical protein GUJ93_ZPchr0006g42364 [Zizania palustris]|uniref:Uncharacterized protein n=1 Tax=Zizania palustris TaxID=103762 RepID=A0A8J5VGZ0_ZIZPA|nr:hypothetical protein GUJ93_ZPchr0006g42364 [Zizania palustris]
MLAHEARRGGVLPAAVAAAGLALALVASSYLLSYLRQRLISWITPALITSRRNRRKRTPPPRSRPLGSAHCTPSSPLLPSAHAGARGSRERGQGMLEQRVQQRGTGRSSHGRGPR